MQYITEFYISQNYQVIKFSNCSNGLNPIIWTNISSKYFKIVFQFWEDFFRTSAAFQLRSCFVSIYVNNVPQAKRCMAQPIYRGKEIGKRPKENWVGNIYDKFLCWEHGEIHFFDGGKEFLLTKYYIQTYKFKTALARTYPGSVIAEKISKTLQAVNKISDIYNVFLENIGF